MSPEIFDKTVPSKAFAKHLKTLGHMVKVVVDVERKIIALGGELHADEEALLLQNGSKQKNLWGANIFPDKHLEYESMINIRPQVNNRSMIIQDPTIKNKVKKIIDKLI